MGDAVELAPAPAGDERTEQPPAKPAAPPKPSHKAGKGSTTPAKGASADTSQGAPSGTPGKRKVDKNVRSVCAGSPKGSQRLSIADHLNALDVCDDSLAQGGYDGARTAFRAVALGPEGCTSLPNAVWEWAVILRPLVGIGP